jgi:hypothetical protein
MAGRKHYQKGRRFERQIVNTLIEAGLLAERLPLSGPAGGGCDVVLPMLGRDYRVEAKHHGASFKQIYGWLALVDLLIVRADRAAPLAVMPLDLLIDLICKAEGKERASYLFRGGGE